MTGRLAGKRAIITAAGQGIGRAGALAYASEGAEVLATDINDDALASLATEHPGIRTAHLDVLNEQAIGALSATEPADILLHCAGYVAGGTILECEQKSWDFSWQINVTAARNMIRAWLPGMINRGQGASIVLIGSIASSIIAAPNRFEYGVTKAALIGLTKSVALDFVQQGVRCNIICPGTIQTPSLDERIQAAADPQQARADFVARQPLGRLGKPEEIASMAVHLGGDESGYTTGQTFILDGGWSVA